MNLLEAINRCQNNEEIDILITKAIEEANAPSTKVEQLGFVMAGDDNILHKGFIPLDTRIKYCSFSMETYGMQTTDFIYDFARFVKQNNIDTKGKLIYSLQGFINDYFGEPNDISREDIFNDVAWKSTKTDDEYFKALENNKLGDLKGSGAAMCTERSALVQQILSIFGFEVYYLMGCLKYNGKEEGHCFNVVKRQNDYALLDYSVPVASFDKNGRFKENYPFVGNMTEDEFKKFIGFSIIKTFNDYEYMNENQKSIIGTRSYIVGEYQFGEKDLDSKNR